jgi:hypothetical protein
VHTGPPPPPPVPPVLGGSWGSRLSGDRNNYHGISSVMTLSPKQTYHVPQQLRVVKTFFVSRRGVIVW